MTLTRRLVARVGPYRILLTAGIVSAMAASVLDGLTVALLIPLLRVLFDVGSVVAEQPTVLERSLSQITNAWFATETVSSVLRNIVLFILGVTVLKSLAGFFASAAGARVTESVGRDLRRELFQRLQQFSVGFHQKQKAGDLMSRVLADVDQAKTMFSEVIPETLHRSMTIVVYIFMLAAISLKLTLVAVVLAPIVAVLLKPVFSRVRKFSGQAADARSKMVVFLHEALRGVREVKVAGAEGYEQRKFDAAASDLAADQTRAHTTKGLSGPLGETAGALVLVVLVLAGAGTALDSQIRPELVVVYLTVALRLLSPVKRLAHAPAAAQHALAGAERVFEILDRPADDVDDATAVREIVRPPQSVVFEDVWFAYEDRDWVLKGINLSVERGQVVGIIGASGGGKSTLLDLLPRFVDPDKGHVLVDGVCTKELSRNSLRRTIGYVGQETIVFNDTVFANIAYGEPVNPSAIEAAATAADAHGFISELPNGYETVLGERGTLLSAGQRQRIALARVLLRDPPVLLLDEATSALDADSERIVLEGLSQLMKDRVVLLVAHRPSSLAVADMVAVLQDGSVARWGPRDEVLGAEGWTLPLSQPAS